MGKVEEGFAKGKPVYVGIDVHKRDWTVSRLVGTKEKSCITARSLRNRSD